MRVSPLHIHKWALWWTERQDVKRNLAMLECWCWCFVLLDLAIVNRVRPWLEQP